MKNFWLLLYYLIAKNLPDSYLPIIGYCSNGARKYVCRHLFKKIGRSAIIQAGVHFGTGEDVEIGDFSSIGKNSLIPNNTKIGKFVMIAQDLYIIANNHAFADIRTPMIFQHNNNKLETRIEDDVWIGAKVIITPGRHIGKGSIIGAGSVLTKDTGEYEIWAGNPAKLIRKRNE